MSRIIRFFFALQCNIKLYHWQTKSYSRHVASDKLLDSVHEHADKFMEVYIGKYGRPKVTKHDDKVQLENMSDHDAEQFIKQAVNFLKTDLPKLLNKNTDTDLFNIIDELMADLNQTLYLFTLE